MPIDIVLETPVPLNQAASRVPRRRGRKTSVSTLHRWATCGLRGVRLETIQVGGTKCTSIQALQRFFDRLSSLPTPTDPTKQRAQGRQDDAERAERELNQRWARGVAKKARPARAGDRPPEAVEPAEDALVALQTLTEGELSE
jgi:hypothetical protein